MSDQNNTNMNAPQTPPKAKKARSKGLAVLIAIIIIAVLAAVLSTAASLITNNRHADTADVPQKSSGFNSADELRKIKKIIRTKCNFTPAGKNYIAILHIEGVIEDKNKTYNQEWLLDTISSLKKDDQNKAILLYIDSPGGGVYQADEVYLTLEDYKTTGKKIYAYMGPLAASGGYYVACAATRIIANRNTLTGSIGVIAGQTFDATGLMEKMGIKSTTITAGKNKNMGNFNQELTDEQKAIMQSIADEAYVQFTNIVANSRKMPAEDVQTLADGRIYTAQQALNNELIDSIASFDNAIHQMEDTEFSGEKLTTELFEYEEKDNFYDFLTGASTALKGILIFAKTGSIEQAFSGVLTQMPYPAYYYER